MPSRTDPGDPACSTRLCSVNWKGTKKKKKDGKDKKGPDLYALLGLKNERFLATPKQLKDGEAVCDDQTDAVCIRIMMRHRLLADFVYACTAAYRKVCLEHHPDKKLVGVEDEEEKERIEEYFKLIQEAYNVSAWFLLEVAVPRQARQRPKALHLPSSSIFLPSSPLAKSHAAVISSNPIASDAVGPSQAQGV